MHTMMDVYVQNEIWREREAHFVKQSRRAAVRPSAIAFSAPTYNPLLHWLGDQLTDWGSQLKRQYGPQGKTVLQS